MRIQINTSNSCQPHVTDNGEAVEPRSALPRVISYIPYGEIFVEQQSGGWQSPYLFNSKELDSETGLYYYGARYLDPTDGMWLSVDPLWEKYVGMSPYGYCAGNPVRLVDVDGRKITEEESINEDNEVKSSASNLKTELSKQKFEATDGTELTEDQIKHNNNIDSRISQLDKTIQDIDDMFADEDIEYKFKKGVPEIKATGEKELTIYWDQKDGRVHEVRHAGQVARREYKIVPAENGGFTFSGYGIEHEIDAYKAQMGTLERFGYYSVSMYNLLHQFPGFDMKATETYWHSVQDVTVEKIRDILDPATFKPLYP